MLALLTYDVVVLGAPVAPSRNRQAPGATSTKVGKTFESKVDSKEQIKPANKLDTSIGGSGSSVSANQKRQKRDIEVQDEFELQHDTGNSNDADDELHDPYDSSSNDLTISSDKNGALQQNQSNVHSTNNQSIAINGTNRDYGIQRARVDKRDDNWSPDTSKQVSNNINDNSIEDNGNDNDDDDVDIIADDYITAENIPKPVRRQPELMPDDDIDSDDIIGADTLAEALFGNSAHKTGSGHGLTIITTRKLLPQADDNRLVKHTDESQPENLQKLLGTLLYKTKLIDSKIDLNFNTDDDARMSPMDRLHLARFS